MTRLRVSIVGVIACAVLQACLVPLPALAHGVPADLAFFGPFGAPTVHCLRVLGTAAQRCFRAALSAERRCLDGQLAGTPCDAAARDAQINAAKQAAEDAVVNACRGGQLTELRFNSFDEVKFDVTHACGDQADAVMSMVYGPALAAPLSVTEPVRQCLIETAQSSQKLLRRALRLKIGALDRMAVRLIPPSRKQAMMKDAEMHSARARQELADQAQHNCAGFATMYGRDATSFLATVESRANCIVGATYVQNALTCPLPVCGNGIKETGEECDDGNRTDDDRCNNSCQLNP